MLIGRAVLVLRRARRVRPARSEWLDLLLGAVAGAAWLAPISVGFFNDVGATRYFIALGPVAAVGAAHIALMSVGGR